MYHHDDRNYDEALAAAKVHLEQEIHKRMTSASRVMERVHNQILVDRMVPSRGLRFSVETQTRKEGEGKKEVVIPTHRVLLAGGKAGGKAEFQEPLHHHALMQVAARADVPEKFITRMLEKPYGGHLIVDNLNTIFREEKAARFLVRSTDDEIRGVLSDTYRRMDSRPILDTFAGACQELGAVPIEGIGGDLRFAIKALIPKVYVAGTKHGAEEVFSFGVSLSNSDVGCGALSLQFFLWRIWCSNTATKEDSLRKVHLGKRLTDEIVYSEETYKADTETMRLAVRDHVKEVLSGDRIDQALAMITTALDTAIEPRAFFERGGELEKLKLTKGEIEKTREVFNDGGVEILPRKTNMARMSQAIAWIAQAADTAERRLELERVACQVMEKAAA